MHCFNFLILLFFIISAEINIIKTDLISDVLTAEKKTRSVGSHSRKRRYLVFPEGSTFSVAVSLNEDVVISPIPKSGITHIFIGGTSWAMSYDLPNETMQEQNNKNEYPIAIRRHKRDLFIKVEKLMTFAGFEGKNCILKTICETAAKLLPKQGILEEIFRIIFTYPEHKNINEGRSSTMYIKAHRDGEVKKNCDALYRCPLSLLELGLGFAKYTLI